MEAMMATGRSLRVLIATEEEHRAYREMIGEALRQMRPRVEVSVVESSEVDEKLVRLDPDVVVRGASGPLDSADCLAWIELSLEPDRPSKIRLEGRCWETANPGIADLLSVVDEAGTLRGLVPLGA
ncbi:MAG: hypothetical protein LC808_11125 [Actinobacteria bacterium]|nr:hypothetical protein [Actinomycetota bacterium]